MFPTKSALGLMVEKHPAISSVQRGQRFMHLSLSPWFQSRKMYSLQFNVTVVVVDSNGPPVAPGAVGFDSFLVKPSFFQNH
jgi:hypothetical protein